MDFFWLIPTGIIAIVFLWILFGLIKKQPISRSPPHVLVDKPAEKPAVDPADAKRDWTHRPVGSYLEWLHSRNGEDKSNDVPHMSAREGR